MFSSYYINNFYVAYNVDCVCFFLNIFFLLIILLSGQPCDHFERPTQLAAFRTAENNIQMVYTTYVIPHDRSIIYVV